VPNTTGNGLFFGGGTKLLLAQLIGVFGSGVFTFLISLAAWGILKAIVGIRVSPDEEYEGLDVGEHGITAYPDFQVASAIRSAGGASGLARSPLVGEPAFVKAKVPTA
jgi:Amt family ammonium transporter